MAASDSFGRRVPNQLIGAVVVICLTPGILHLLGVDFATAIDSLDAGRAGAMSSQQFEDAVFGRLAGAFTHTILEWTAFCTAFFTVVLAFIHFSIKRDVATPVIGMALFFAGSMDAFHTLAADRLIEAVADNRNLVPFTWAICRLFNALIMMLGLGLFLLLPSVRRRGGLTFIVALSVLFGVVAYTIIHYAATSSHLPQTMYPAALVTRPYDVGPLLLFLLAGFVIYPRVYRRAPSLFSHALIISVIPEVVTQLHMAFGSTALFDAHFNIAHFLKIIAYLVPFLGLSMDYIQTYREEQLSVTRLREIEAVLRSREDELKHLNEGLEEIVTVRTQEARQALDDLRQAEAQLVQSGKLASIGQLAAGVAHEINNPVGFVQSNLSTLRDYAGDISKLVAAYASLDHRLEAGDAGPIQSAREQIGRLKQEMDLDYVIKDLDSLIEESLEGVARVGKIVQNLRDFSHVDNEERQLASLHDGLDATLNIAWNELKYKTTIEKDYGDIPLVLCWPMELNQVFMNILINAGQAIDERGVISIRTYREEDWICVAISDTGKGMTPEVKDRIFEPFFTTKDVGEGTGLGLHVSYSIVKKHGGDILVDSQVGIGTTFTIKIPAGG